MSDFIMVVPPDWVEIATPEQIMSEESWLSANPWEVTEAMKNINVIPDDGITTIVDHRIFRDSGVLRLWVLIGKEA